MQPRSLEQRVTMLEEQMQELRELPARVAGVELQILQLRDDVRDGFSAIRDEVHSVRDELRDEIRAGNQESQDFMRAIYERIQTDIRTMGEGDEGRRR